MSDQHPAGVIDSASGADTEFEAIGRLYGVDASVEKRRETFVSGSVPVAVYGLGKMGLPLAAVFAEATGNVLGADVDPDVVSAIQGGDCHVKREPGLDELVAERVDAGALAATEDPREAAERCSVHVVIVPTPITDDHEPDLSILDSVVAAIGGGLESGDLVLIECTVPPRTTEERVLPALEEASGLSRGEFGLAFCPERTASGRALTDIRGAYPKVVGGADDESARAARAVYEEINDTGVLTVSDAATAECVKVFEGLYRDVNIALANELATFTDEFGVDVREAIDVANTQPYCDIHDPGPGVGGHCIPFYPYFVIEPFETDAPLLETAREVNDAMPAFTVGTLQREFAAEGTDLGEADVLVLGLTYRPNVEEIRAAPSLSIVEELSDAGATVHGVDPMLDSYEAFAERGLTPIGLEAIYDRSFDGVLLVTNHDEFDAIRWAEIERDDGQLVVIDGHGSLDSAAIAATGHRRYVLGSGRDGPETTRRGEPDDV